MYTTAGGAGFGRPSPVSLMPPATPAGHRGASETRFPRASYGAVTIQNVGKGGDENQDTYITSSNSSGSKNFVGVFDGHGERGKVMSSFVRHTLAKSLFANKDLQTNPVSALENAYRDTQREIEHQYSRDAVQSGSTAVAAYQHRDKLFVANVGDSRAVLGRCDTARRTYNAVELSSDHKPSRPDERERVLAAGGTVDQMAIPIIQNGNLRWIRGGPERVMDRHGMGGLAMSRSMGDLALRPYVSSTPEVTTRKLDGKDRFLVLGSDGVWDHISSQEAVTIASQYPDPNAAAREIASIARRRWHEETGGMLSDDITAVVMKLDTPPSTPGSLAGAGSSGAALARANSRSGNTTPANSSINTTASNSQGKTLEALRYQSTRQNSRGPPSRWPPAGKRSGADFGRRPSVPTIAATAMTTPGMRRLR